MNGHNFPVAWGRRKRPNALLRVAVPDNGELRAKSRGRPDPQPLKPDVCANFDPFGLKYAPVENHPQPGVPAETRAREDRRRSGGEIGPRPRAPLPGVVDVDGDPVSTVLESVRQRFDVRRGREVDERERAVVPKAESGSDRTGGDDAQPCVREVIEEHCFMVTEEGPGVTEDAISMFRIQTSEILILRPRTSRKPMRPADTRGGALCGFGQTNLGVTSGPQGPARPPDPATETPRRLRYVADASSTVISRHRDPATACLPRGSAASRLTVGVLSIE